MRLITKAKLREFLENDVLYTFFVERADELIVDGSVNLTEFAKFVNDYCSGVENSSAKESFEHEHDPIPGHEHGGEAGGA